MSAEDGEDQMSYDSEINQSNGFSEEESEVSQLDNQQMTKKERKDEKKYLQNDIQAMMDQLGSESALKNIAPVTKKVKQQEKDISSTEPSSTKIEPKKVNFSQIKSAKIKGDHVYEEQKERLRDKKEARKRQ